MGDDSRWRRFGSFNCGNDVVESKKLIVFRTCNNVNATPPFPRIADRSFLLSNPTSIPPPMSSGHAAVAAQKRLLVFDRSIDRTTEPMSSCSRIHSLSPPFTNEAKVSNDEMHEDTEEIDALLDSESENYCKEEEASTGNSPFETVTSENTVNVPTKRRRLSYADLDDTASSAHDHEEVKYCGLEHQSKRQRRERIEETVGVLRRIVPFGRRRKGDGGEVAAVIDDAIRYLRSLKAEGQRVG